MRRSIFPGLGWTTSSENALSRRSAERTSLCAAQRPRRWSLRAGRWAARSPQGASQCGHSWCARCCSISLTKAHQDGLNPQGINCIRNLNGNIYVWGARTLGGDANGEYKYVSTRRLLNFLRESIEEGTQFVVFEPNNPGLWQRIKRSVGDFLLGQWRAGALFGETPEKAFFVKCDAETNPPDVREAGQVVTEIGVAIVKPAEFVIFRIQQQTGG